jgi:hypothetical protein
MAHSSFKKKLEFERTRRCFLISARILRGDVKVARIIAEELFKTEVEACLTRKKRRADRRSFLLQRVIMFLLGIFSVCLLLMVLNVQPFLNLKIGGASILLIFFAATGNALIARRFKKQVQMIMNAYEAAKQLFIKSVLDKPPQCEEELRNEEEVLHVCM